ncbi:unnamed protein product [Urochloa humidicola]
MVRGQSMQQNIFICVTCSSFWMLSHVTVSDTLSKTSTYYLELIQVHTKLWPCFKGFAFNTDRFGLHEYQVPDSPELFGIEAN